MAAVSIAKVMTWCIAVLCGCAWEEDARGIGVTSGVGRSSLSRGRCVRIRSGSCLLRWRVERVDASWAALAVSAYGYGALRSNNGSATVCRSAQCERKAAVNLLLLLLHHCSLRVAT